ncbi:hypothetical protein ACRE_018280 [Hapsidospora chrysogenum ATCC 11550]|uniref:Uncharacterized protein n=1 Tax=Hapsidospora chrysogenum (strain ATCC 11550 / CBS 779.69 / DSM 880 / IAM 14645 / JCM 23072 / IMI 49137) TaxID=857340 RepID=A0A086TDI1_HAPC1|nr:hypothetical protein ACRE_018280 [Hapsidospora chrysogenum ATCC 11550]
MPQHTCRDANRKRSQYLLSARGQLQHNLDGPLSFLEPYDKRNWGRDELRGRHARPAMEPILNGDISMDDVDIGKAIDERKKDAEQRTLSSHRSRNPWRILCGFKGTVSFDILGQVSYANAVRTLLSFPKGISCSYTLVWYDANREMVKSNDYRLPAKDSECSKDPYCRALINIRKAMATRAAQYFLVKRCNEKAPEHLRGTGESRRDHVRDRSVIQGMEQASEEQRATGASVVSRRHRTPKGPSPLRASEQPGVDGRMSCPTPPSANGGRSHTQSDQQTRDKRRDVTKASTGSDYIRRPIPQPLNAVLRGSDSLPEITKAVLTPTEQARLQQAYREVESIHLDRDQRCPIPRCTAVFNPLDEDEWLEHFREQHAVDECPFCQDDIFVAENRKQVQEEVEMAHLDSARPQASEPRPEANEPSKTNNTPGSLREVSSPTSRPRSAHKNSRKEHETAKHGPATRGKKRPRSPRFSDRIHSNYEDPQDDRFDDSLSVACPKLDHVDEPTPRSRQRQDVIPGLHGRKRPRRNNGGMYVYTSDSDSADELQPDVDDLAPPKRRRVNDPTYKPSWEGRNSEDELPAGPSVPNGARRGTQSTTPNKKASLGVSDLSAEFTQAKDSTEITAKKPTPRKSAPRKPTPKKATPKKSTPGKPTPNKKTPKKATPNRVIPKKVTVEDANTDEEDADIVPEKAVPKETASKTTGTPEATSGKEAAKKATPKKATPTKNNAVEVTPGSGRVTRSAARAAAAEAGDKL